MKGVISMGYFYLFVAGSVLAAIFRIPIVKGKIGEWLTARKLARLNREEYFLINNLMIRGHDGKTSQIDHVLVSCYGVFVIEVKNYQGYIFGKDSDLYWTVVMNKHTRHKLYNPIRQNEGHIEALQDVLRDYPSLVFHPIVVFAGSATLRTDTEGDVVYLSKLLRLIKSFDVRLMSPGEVDTIHHRLQSANITDKQAAREHVARVAKISRRRVR